MDGILNVYKESGWTSNDVVIKLRGILQTKKIGHGGTLDPMVTGVLPIAVGKATRLLEYMDSAGKTYEGEITLGFSTETEDAEGAVVECTVVPEESINPADIDDIMIGFVGIIEQTPPMYSAIKVNGKRLYEYARAGLTIERPVRKIEIKEFVRTSNLSYLEDCVKFSFRVACGKGTYIRTLAVDLAKKLGYAGHMSYLVRTMANGLMIADSNKISEIENIVRDEKISEILRPLSITISGMTRLNLTGSQMEDVSHGKIIIETFPENEKVACFYNDDVVAIYESHNNVLKAKKVLL